MFDIRGMGLVFLCDPRIDILGVRKQLKALSDYPMFSDVF